MNKILILVAALLLVTAACSKQEDRSAGKTVTESTRNATDTTIETTNDAADAADDVAVANVTEPSAQTLKLGKKIYSANCFACHGTGAAGAPKLGDKESWAPRLAQDIDTLHQHAITGFNGATGYMPPRGGFANLSDEEVKAAVDYMVHEDQ